MENKEQTEMNENIMHINQQVRETLQEAQERFTGKTTEEPEWFKKYREEQAQLYQQLRNDNDALIAAKQHEEQQARIIAAAKTTGIPSYLVEHLKIDTEGDIEQQLTALKQKMVNHSILPDDTQRRADNNKSIMLSDADEWAKGIG